MRTWGALIFRALASLALMLNLAYFTFVIRIADADARSKERTSEAFRAAIEAVPEDWELYEDWAENSPPNATFALKQAISLNPLNPGIRHELAASAEAAGQYAEAEANLQIAGDLDQSSISKSKLAEFYFRRRNPAQFWPAIRVALLSAPTDPTLLFQDCWKMNPNGDLIWKAVAPAGNEVWLDYFRFLVAEDHLAAAEPVAMILMAEPSSDWKNVADNSSLKDSMTRFCDQLVTHNSPQMAVKIWNWLANRNLIPFEELAPQIGRFMTDSDFRTPFSSLAFDWRPTGDDGVFLEPRPKERALRINFGGREPENCELLAQFVPLWPDQSYRFRVKYATTIPANHLGLRWKLTLPTGADVLKNTVSERAARLDETALVSDLEKEETFSFSGLEKPTVGRLALVYERALGTSRIEGDVTMSIGLDK